jgi:hypothetical protein
MNQGSRSEPPFDLADIEFGEMLGRIRAQHRVALELHRAGDVVGALVVATRPIMEILPRASRELWRDRHASARLSKAASAVAYSVRSGASESDVAGAVEEAAGACAGALAARVGTTTASSPAFAGSVVVALLETTAGAYAAALDRVGQARVAAYRDAYGCAREAEDGYSALVADLEAPGGTRTLIPSLDPPSSLAGIDELRNAVEAMAAHLAPLGAVVDQAPTPADVLRRIDRLLAEAGEAYGGGNAHRAGELVARCYVEHYWTIVPALKAAAPEVAARLEPLVGVELRTRIHDSAPPREIAALVKAARGLVASIRLSGAGD